MKTVFGRFLIIVGIVFIICFSADRCRAQCACDTSGMYMPALNEQAGVPGVVDIDSAHFIKSGSQVAVWGNFGFTPGTVGTRVVISPTLPFPSTLTGAFDAEGFCLATQKPNVGVQSGYVITVPSGLVTCIYYVSVTGRTNLIYHFVYTIKP